MTFTSLLAHYIRKHGEIKTARVSSAQSSTKYSYWGAARYVLRLAVDSQPANVAVERATSDRRSERLADRDCDDLCEREDRIRLQKIGRLDESQCHDILSRLGDEEIAKAVAKHNSRIAPAQATKTLAQRLAEYKAAKRQADIKDRIDALAAAQIEATSHQGKWVIASRRHAKYTTWFGKVSRMMLDDATPIACSVHVTSDLPPTVAEAEALLAEESRQSEFRSRVRCGAAKLGKDGDANDGYAWWSSPTGKYYSVSSQAFAFVAAAADDDVAKLILADWLEEHPEACNSWTDKNQHITLAAYLRA